MWNFFLFIIGTQEEAAHAYDIAAIEYRGMNAVTNFDLSTYIRWLKPGANHALASSHELKTALASNPFPLDQTNDLTLFNSNIFSVPASDNQKKRDVLQNKVPSSPCAKSSSSPTALSLLLRSSMFNKLVEQNSNAKYDETEEDAKELTEKVNNNGEGEMLYNDIAHVPFMFSSNKGFLPGLEYEERKLPLYNKTGQSLWKGVLNLPSLQ